jgi:hypothetical protein
MTLCGFWANGLSGPAAESIENAMDDGHYEVNHV